MAGIEVATVNVRSGTLELFLIASVNIAIACPVCGGTITVALSIPDFTQD